MCWRSGFPVRPYGMLAASRQSPSSTAFEPLTTKTGVWAGKGWSIMHAVCNAGFCAKLFFESSREPAGRQH